ncbi:hypothetical protein BH20ACT23_BH20ACT23_09450 [soil metagenome]
MRTRVVATLAVIALIATAVGVAVARRGDSTAGRTIAAPLPKHVPGDFMLSRSGDQNVPENAFERALARPTR